MKKSIINFEQFALSSDEKHLISTLGGFGTGSDKGSGPIPGGGGSAGTNSTGSSSGEGGTNTGGTSGGESEGGGTGKDGILTPFGL